jgi:hypothetical protein
LDLAHLNKENRIDSTSQHQKIVLEIVKELNLYIITDIDNIMKEKLSHFVTLENVGRVLKVLALLTFSVSFIFLTMQLWTNFWGEMKAFRINHFREFNPTKLLPSVTFCPLPGKDLFVTLIYPFIKAIISLVISLYFLIFLIKPFSCFSLQSSRISLQGIGFQFEHFQFG